MKYLCFGLKSRTYSDNHFVVCLLIILYDKMCFDLFIILNAIINNIQEKKLEIEVNKFILHNKRQAFLQNIRINFKNNSRYSYGTLNKDHAPKIRTQMEMFLEFIYSNPLLKNMLTV